MNIYEIMSLGWFAYSLYFGVLYVFGSEVASIVLFIYLLAAVAGLAVLFERACGGPEE